MTLKDLVINPTAERLAKMAGDVAQAAECHSMEGFAAIQRALTLIPDTSVEPCEELEP